MISRSHLSDVPSEDEWEPPSEENGESSLEDEGKLDNSRSSDDVRMTKEADGGTSEPCPLCHGSGMRNGSLVKEDNQISSGNEGTSRSNDERQNGRHMGSLFISRVEIGKGSNGTTVFHGTYGERDGEKRLVAVKRLLRNHHQLSGEIPHLIASDKHSNIVRYFTAKRSQDFVYLALERGDFSLDFLIQALIDSSNRPVFSHEYEIKLDSVRKAMQGRELWRPDGHPSPLLLKLMWDIVSGLVHLHKLGIIHRDLNPRNVLIITDPSLLAMLSDMGISKCLPQGKFSLGCPASGSGTKGWQAPEQLCNGRQTCNMDMFNLGCLLFFCLTRGEHPFGRDIARDLNIEVNKIDLSLVDFIPEAYDLISRLLKKEPELRLKASEVLRHPLFWNSVKRLSFCSWFSNRLESENWPNSDILKTLQCTARVVFGKSWIGKIHQDFFNYLKQYRFYYGGRVQDLLRAERNAFSHFGSASINVKKIVGSASKDLEAYFTKQFPRLLMESYNVAFQFCKGDPGFQEFLSENQLSDVLTP